VEKLLDYTRKKIYGELNAETFKGNNGYSQNDNYNLDLTFQPINALNITLSSSFIRNVNEMQYVATSDTETNPRYLVGKIDQTVARISLRLTYMITPNISVQYWGQPFGTSGQYSNFKTITDSRASSYAERFAHIQTGGLALNNGIYEVDENTDGTTDYRFGKPDFNFGQFRSNMVIRWEYIPGSTVFLVWTQERNGAFYDRSDPDHKKYSLDFHEKAYNIFLVKFTYRFVL
jgi:hypothetical protein